MKVLVRDRALIMNPTEEAKELVYDLLTFQNPKYIQAMRSGVSNIWHPSELEFFSELPNGNLIVPKGFVDRFKQEFKCPILYRTIKGEKQDFKFYGKLRKYQENAVNDIILNPHSILEASTGAGKTVMGTYIIARRKRTTLIIVHSKELMYQWQSALKKFLHYDCGLIGDKHYNVKPITVGIINSVKNKIDELFYKFGQIVCDETHRCPSTMWTETITEFESHYQLGLSATVYRNDGLDLAIQYHIGPVKHRVDPEELHREGAVLVPKIIRIETDLRIYNEERFQYQDLVKSLIHDKSRNELIVEKVLHDIQKYKENVLLITDRIDHAKMLKEKLTESNVKVEILHAKVDAIQRKRIVQKVKMGKIDALISTAALIGEGFDAPNLSALFLTTPIKFKGRLAQVIGRVLRPEENKKPRVYDFRDMQVEKFRYQAYSRDKSYYEMWGKND